ncbi:carboxypeptidase-like regulatory domain-containing protein [Algoriphagus confluentis]|uniref:Carboxypeptidase regulatory-like domain-containing protein n=1 Tax=Algoriphagus confluentis TaxID=1697556 RepID=A0ABQ6PRX2_9BACT|nr:hypothetical protein Aconfl_31260 [Algoriphagus confluentis]
MKKVLIFGIVFFGWLLSSCDSYEFPPVGAEKGSISGSLALFDEGTTQKASSAGMRISLEGTDPLIFTFSDQFGRFELKNVPFGSYAVVYEKEGYGTFRYLGEDDGDKFEHLPEIVNSKIPHFLLGEKSTTKIQNVNVEKVVGGYRFSVEGNPGGSISRERYFSFLVSTTNPNFSERDFDYSFKYSSNSNLLVVFLPDAVYESLLHPQTGKAYLKVYGNSYHENLYVENGRVVFPNLNPVSSELILLEKN